MAVSRALIERLLQTGRQRDVWHLVAGISSYCGGELRRTFPRESVGPKDGELWIFAVRYLADLTLRGYDRCHEYERERFEEWIDAGAPWLFEDELEAYLREYPLE